MIYRKNNIKIVATILAKNEEDIIATNIEHHISQGVSKFIITDNASTDATRSIISKYPEVVEIIDEPGDDHRQSEWVTRMAKLACKLNPDWIIHLDADELWCGLNNLRMIQNSYVGCTGMYLHPPTQDDFDLRNMRHYLDFDHITKLPSECKVAHRPDKDVIITHGNHGFINKVVHYTSTIWRHHYPIRNIRQFESKATLGHAALIRRNSTCDRWKQWNDICKQGSLQSFYFSICDTWKNMILHPNINDFSKLMEFWSTPEVIQFFKTNSYLPKIGEWPKLS